MTISPNLAARGEKTRRNRRERKSLLASLRGQNGAIDLASIMTGVLVIGIIGGVIAATVFVVIPWSQDEAAKGDLSAIKTAESVFATTHGGNFADLVTLQTTLASGGSGVGKALLPATIQPTAINANETGFIAVEKSQTGNLFYVTSLSPNVSSTVPTVLPDGLTVPVLPGAAWSIPDPALRDMILWSLGKPSTGSLDINDATTLYYLDGGLANGPVDPSWGASFNAAARLASVRDLTGLEKATNLNDLVIGKSAVADLTPVAGLTQIKYIDLSQTAVTDLSPLAGMTQLTSLDLSQTAVTDLSPLAGMTQLTSLDLSQTAVTDLTPLAGLKGLTSLSFSNTRVTNLTPLGGLSALQHLTLNDTPVADLTPIANLRSVETLQISRTSVTNISALTNWPVAKLFAWSTSISDMTPVTGWTVYK